LLDVRSEDFLIGVLFSIFEGERGAGASIGATSGSGVSGAFSSWRLDSVFMPFHAFFVPDKMTKELKSNESMILSEDLLGRKVTDESTDEDSMFIC